MKTSGKIRVTLGGDRFTQRRKGCKGAKGAIQFIALLLLSTFSFSQIKDSSILYSGESKVFHSDILNEDRTIFIQTPSRMMATDQYPVLYVLDGEAMFTMISGQVKYLSESYKIVPSMIVVGIKNTDRVRDLTPTHSIIGPDGKPDTSANAMGKNSGGGEKFLQFIEQELMPYINSNYPVAPYRILAGHSLGGLMAVHSMLNHPQQFNAYIALSPSFQWDDKVVLKQAVTKINVKTVVNKLLFYSDASEGGDFHRNVVAFDSVLNAGMREGASSRKDRDTPAPTKFRYVYYPDETHISEPVKGFYEGIRFIYPNWHLNYNSAAFRKTMTADTIIAHYTRLSEMYHYRVLPPQNELNQLSRFLANDPKLKEMINFFK